METLFSLSREIPAAGPVPAASPIGGLQAGSIARGSIREACFVRKLSGGGAILHSEAPVQPGDRLEIDLSGHHLVGEVAWRHGNEVGLSFDAPIDVFALIARNLVSQPGERRRLPRIELRCPAQLEAGGRTERVTTRDVSQGGAKVETQAALRTGMRVRLRLDGFLPIESIVRWCENGVAGIAFEPELSWQELMPWLKERRDAALRLRPADAAPEAPRHPLTPAGTEVPPADTSVSLNLSARVREGTRRWGIEVAAITTEEVQFESFAALRLGTLIWVVLPGLEGWPARVVSIEGYRFTCSFTQPLHPAVLERILAAVQDGR